MIKSLKSIFCCQKECVDSNGFTLLEIMLTVAIFAICSVAISGIFLAANNLQNQLANSQRVQSDARYILEKIAKEVRGNELSLVYNLTNSTTTLSFMTDELGYAVAFKFDTSTKSLLYKNSGQWVPLNSEDIIVSDVKFYIFPTKDPFVNTSSTSNEQPRVTVTLEMKNKYPGRFQKTIFLQTTISSKYYKR